MNKIEPQMHLMNSVPPVAIMMAFLFLFPADMGWILSTATESHHLRRWQHLQQLLQCIHELSSAPVLAKLDLLSWQILPSLSSGQQTGLYRCYGCWGGGVYAGSPVKYFTIQFKWVNCSELQISSTSLPKYLRVLQAFMDVGFLEIIWGVE